MSEWRRWRNGLRRHLTLQAGWVAHYDYRRQTCGPSSFASVELTLEPSDAYRFVSQCEWPTYLTPSERRGLEDAIAAGVYDALQPSGGEPYHAGGVVVTCTRIEWDDVGSSPNAFYAASWHATRQARDQAQWKLVDTPQSEAAEQSDAADEARAGKSTRGLRS